MLLRLTHAINSDGSVDYEVSEEYDTEPNLDNIPPFSIDDLAE